MAIDADRRAPRHGFKALPHRGPAVSNALIDRLRVKRALLDINVLLALLDSDHVDHVGAHEWLDEQIDAGWASCATTENGFVRIISQPRYPSPIAPAEAIELLALAVAHDGRLAAPLIGARRHRRPPDGALNRTELRGRRAVGRPSC